MKIASKKILKKLKVQVNKDGGFTVWLTDNKGSQKYWILDGSCVQEDGEVRLNNLKDDVNAIYDANTNTIKIV